MEPYNFFDVLPVIHDVKLFLAHAVFPCTATMTIKATLSAKKKRHPIVDE